ncbi:hypothetical protein E5198_03930, partial [Pseudomonas sp. A-1]
TAAEAGPAASAVPSAGAFGSGSAGEELLEPVGATPAAVGEPVLPIQGEQRQALEQWLRQIPDDPAELLRRKFWYEQQRHQEKPR